MAVFQEKSFLNVYGSREINFSPQEDLKCNIIHDLSAHLKVCGPSFMGILFLSIRNNMDLYSNFQKSITNVLSS